MTVDEAIIFLQKTANKASKIEITINVVTQVVKNVNEFEIQQYVKDLETFVAEYFDVDKTDFKGSSRKHDVIKAKSILFHLLESLPQTEFTRIKIAKLYNRDHSSISEILNKTFINYYDTDSEFRLAVHNLKQKANQL